MILKEKKLSVIVPIYNEKENILGMYDNLKYNLDTLDCVYEIIFIDDGSKDGSWDFISDIASKDSLVKAIRFKRNFGQTAAISAGFDHAAGDIIITMDGDLQNDPKDIKKILDKIEEGYDVVCGWRKKRKDPLFTKKIPSFFANILISWVTGVHLHDYGCTLKGYKKEVIEDLKLYGELHRFIPAIASRNGASIAEVEVHHNPRTRGSSKYTVARFFKVILDLITVKFLGTYITKPIYPFGVMGLFSISLGFILAIKVLIDKYFFGTWVHKNPRFLLSILFGLIGTLFIVVGLLAEIMMRTYYESQNKSIYKIKEIAQKE